jgi:SpoIID/LytB domain protein
LRGRRGRDNKFIYTVAMALLALLLAMIIQPAPGVDSAQAVGGKVTFVGHGKGHGVGMCMAGVYYRALRGEEYHGIIHTYYSGVGFATVSDDMPLKILCRDGIIRTYSMREYLYRLQEEPDSWPSEGLKVLAVAARTYALSCIARGKHADDGYDLCPYGSCCQAFNEQIDPATRPNTVAAVNATAGEIITYQGEPIVAAYSSCCGGHTAAASEVWGGTGYPYWKPVPDDACALDPNHDWTVDMSWDELQAKLNLNASTAVGNLYDFDVLSRGVSGRVLYVRIDGSAGSVTVSGSLFASVAGLETNFFYVGQQVQNFDEYLLIQNPGDINARCQVTFMFPGGSVLEEECVVGAHSRYTICVNDRVQNAEVSVKIASDQAVVAERAMYFDFLGSGRNGGHACMGVKEPTERWYFAEGYTGGNFDTFVLVQNPNTTEAHLTASFMGDSGVVDEFIYTLSPSSRMTIWMDQEPGLDNGEFSTKLDSDLAVVAERAVYFDYEGKKGGTASEGMPEPAARWYFAEGYTGNDFDTWILLSNPNETAAEVALTFMLPDASTTELPCEVAPLSRATVHVDDVAGLENAEFSTSVESSIPLVAERAMYFDYFQKIGGHDVMGNKQPSDQWYFAEGYTAGDFDTYILLQNPGSQPAETTLFFMLGDGSVTELQAVLQPHSRHTVHADDIAGLEEAEFSTHIRSTQPIMAERAMYFDYKRRSGGSCAQGTPSPAKVWYFAEGYTGS